MTLSHGAFEFGLQQPRQSFCDVITAVLSKLKLLIGPVHIKLFMQAINLRSSEGGKMLSSSVIDDVRLALRANN